MVFDASFPSKQSKFVIKLDYYTPYCTVKHITGGKGEGEHQSVFCFVFYMLVLLCFLLCLFLELLPFDEKLMKREGKNGTQLIG